ncbi:MAG: hypothetical protein JST28_00215 [Acidobacteria bacterium]|nr:hypothetical protein [Acidobacteriota bacterium]
MPDRDELDRLIDSELARYGEPRAGLEQRILARVAAQTPRASWLFHGWQRWAIPGMIAVAILLVAGVQRFTHHDARVSIGNVINPVQSPVASAKGAGLETPIQVPPSHGTTRVRHIVAHRSKSIDVAVRVAQPKLDVFPTPQALSEKEQSLIDLAKYLPDAERQKLLTDRQASRAPLEIASIKISPITMPELGKN